MLWWNLKKNSKKSNCSRIRSKMNDKDLRRRMIGNSRALLARQLFENSALTRHLFENSALNSFAHLLQNANPILNSLLANVICHSVLRKVDKGTQTLLRIPTKPTFYIRYPWPTINRWIWLFTITFFCYPCYAWTIIIQWGRDGHQSGKLQRNFNIRIVVQCYN